MFVAFPLGFNVYMNRLFKKIFWYPKDNHVAVMDHFRVITTSGIVSEHQLLSILFRLLLFVLNVLNK